MAVVPAIRHDQPEPVVAWTESRIAELLASTTFRDDLVCPNCTHLGFEADLLVVHRSLRLIDVEIKISRADLKADIDKDKWWRRPYWGYSEQRPDKVRLDWPRNVWKHYYAMPEAVWKPELADVIPATSGVMLICADQPIPEWGGPTHTVRHVRRARPNRDAEPVQPHTAIRIARLVSLRYWAARSAGRLSDLEGEDVRVVDG